MRSARIATLSILWGLVFALGIFVLPGAASADVATKQVLPPGGTSCITPSVYGFKAYEYDGALHSFEFFVSDASYVAVSGAAGGAQVPFFYASRRNVDGSMRIHIDLPTTSLDSALPIQIAMLSASNPSTPTCLSVFTTSVSGKTSSQKPARQQPEKSAEQTTPAAILEEGASVSRETDTDDVSRETSEKSPLKSGAAAGFITSAFTSLSGIVSSMCTPSDGPMRLWAFLLALYALLLIGTVFGSFQAIGPVEPTHLKWGGVALPLILFAAFWYLAESCRPGIWPIAILALFAGAAGYGLTKETWTQSVLQLPGPSKTS